MSVEGKSSGKQKKLRKLKKSLGKISKGLNPRARGVPALGGKE